MSPSRLPKTNEQYAIKAKNIRSQAAKSYGYTSPDTVPPLTLVEHLISRKTSMSKNTWWQYKSALRHHFETILETTIDGTVAEETRAAIEMLNTEPSTGSLKYGSQTSALKQKGIKLADYKKLMDYLNENIGVHRYANALKTWLQASKITGLRPSEWENASLLDLAGHRVLVVKNAKATNGRAHGEERTLVLDDLSASEMEKIDDMLQMIEGYGGEMDFERFQKRMKDYMTYATRHCYGNRKKYPTLYSFRHQFSADAKLSGLSKQEIAALMGHGSDETAGTHYARKISGNSVVKISPVGSEVKRVRERARKFIPRANQTDQG